MDSVYETDSSGKTTHYTSVMTNARLFYGVGLVIFMVGLVCTFSLMFSSIMLSTLTIRGINLQEFAQLGDYIGGTVGTAATIMNVGAFLILTYAIGAAQQRNHQAQLDIQVQTHLLQYRMAVIAEFKKATNEAHKELDELLSPENEAPSYSYGAWSVYRRMQKQVDGLNHLFKDFSHVEELLEMFRICSEIDDRLSKGPKPDRLWAIKKASEAMMPLYGIQIEMENITFDGLGR